MPKRCRRLLYYGRCYDAHPPNGSRPAMFFTELSRVVCWAGIPAGRAGEPSNGQVQTRVSGQGSDGRTVCIRRAIVRKYPLAGGSSELTSTSMPTAEGHGSV